MAKVYLVDDSTIVTNMVTNFLLDRGYEVKSTNSPFGVSGKIRDFGPEVVLMDLGLPGLSGRKLIDLIRQQGGGMNCKVLLFSSTDEEEMKNLVERGLADDYFIKGNSLNDLEAKIRRLTS